MSPIPLGILAASGVEVAAGGAFDLLTTTLVSSNTSSVVFSNLVSNYASSYKHLQLRMVLRTNQANDNLGNVRIEVNGVQQDYNSHELYGDATGDYSTTSGTSTFMMLSGATTKAQSGAAKYALTITDIYEPFTTNKKTTFMSMIGGFANTEEKVALASGLFNYTNAVDSIEIYVPSASWVSGCRFSLYGMGA